MAKKKMNTVVEDSAGDKTASLKLAIDQIIKDHGVGAICAGYQRGECEVIPTGALAIDLATDVGGIPRGRITEIYGPEASGKTTLALSVAAQAQRAGGVVAFIDAEHALDPTWATKIGVDMDKILISQPDYGEQALQIVERLALSGSVALIVVDSVAALTPKAEIEGQVGDSNIGAQARMMSQALRKLVSVVNRTNTTIIFINQLREKIGVMFGSPETTPGGKALKFYASMRLDVRKIGQLKEKEQVYANNCRVKVVKNKVGRPFRQAEFQIHYEDGLDGLTSLVTVAVDLGVLTKKGGYHYLNGELLANSEVALIAVLKANRSLFEQIESMVYEKMAIEDTIQTGGGVAEETEGDFDQQEE